MRPDSQDLAKLREKIQLRAHAWSAMHASVSRGEHSSSLKENPRSRLLAGSGEADEEFPIAPSSPNFLGDYPDLTFRSNDRIFAGCPRLAATRWVVSAFVTLVPSTLFPT